MRKIVVRSVESFSSPDCFFHSFDYDDFCSFYEDNSECVTCQNCKYYIRDDAALSMLRDSLKAERRYR